MPRLVLLLAAFLGWVAYDRYAKVGSSGRAPRATAFPFPTSDSHDTISLRSVDDTARWCEVLGCSEAQLHAALSVVGSSAERVREHLAARSSP